MNNSLTYLFDVHNAIRVLYNRPPLVWDDGLAARAKQWADARVLGHDAPTQNLMFSAGRNMPIAKAPCKWLANAEHRNTLLSAEIEAVGCGFSRDDSGVFVICNYEPTPTIYDEDQKSVCNQIIHY